MSEGPHRWCTETSRSVLNRPVLPRPHPVLDVRELVEGEPDRGLRGNHQHLDISGGQAAADGRATRRRPEMVIAPGDPGDLRGTSSHASNACHHTCPLLTSRSSATTDQSRPGNGSMRARILVSSSSATQHAPQARSPTCPGVGTGSGIPTPDRRGGQRQPHHPTWVQPGGRPRPHHRRR